MALLSSVSLAAAFAQSPEAPAQASTRTVYRGATLIDGKGGPPLGNQTIVTQGDRIEAVLPDEQVTPALLGGAKIVDIRGRFVLPGLIDSHQHIATPPNHRRAEALMRRALYSGVTAVRIMADDLRPVAEMARAALVGETAAPDLYYAALMAGPSFFEDPRTQAVSAGVKPGDSGWMQSIDDKTDLRLAVARARGTGATAIKIYANLPPHLVRRIAAEAHRQGMQVWAHGMVFPTPPADVIAAGPDVISHTCYLAYQVMPNRPQSYQQRSPIDPAPFAHGDNPVIARLFAEMRRRHMILDPTLRVYQEMERQSGGSGRRPYCTLDLASLLTAQAHRAGIPMSAGTDGDTDWSAPYPAVFDELELLVHRAGLSPAEAIQSATRIGAQAAGQADQMGTIEAGKLANLVVLDRDPLADIANMRTVVLTVKRGRTYARTDYKPVTAEEVPAND